ncbi:MAG: hypothetical protein U5O39_16290 [Gammaproteobacteria bacterium]|nr:hypothetical protein [Gammaproteobacteria bacterium]
MRSFGLNALGNVSERNDGTDDLASIVLDGRCDQVYRQTRAVLAPECFMTNAACLAVPHGLVDGTFILRIGLIRCRRDDGE